MPRSRRLRRRPSTPNLNHHQHSFTADPASPPETPITSPQFSRKISLKPRHQNDPFFEIAPSLGNDPNIKPVGNGHQFSYQPSVGPEQLSPRSSTSSSIVAIEDSADDESSESASLGSLPNAPPAGQSRYQAFLTRQTPSDDSDADEEDADDDDEEDDEEDDDEDTQGDEEDGGAEQPRNATRPTGPTGPTATSLPTRTRAPTAAALLWDFILEEIDPMDNTLDALEVLYPYEIESARSRSSSWHRDIRDLDRSMMRDLRNLNCSNEASDNEPEFDLEEDIFLKRQQEMRRLRRVSMSSSVGKRTHSELSDSDEDFRPLDVNDVGSSARRLRKRLHRCSLLFQDPPEQIEELEEPNSSEDEFQAGQSLAQELPYWTMEIMEMGASP